MITRVDDFEFEVSCTNCGTEEIIDTAGNWGEMIRELKSLGWKVQKDADDEWAHYCPSCAASVDFKNEDR